MLFKLKNYLEFVKNVTDEEILYIIKTIKKAIL